MFRSKVCLTLTGSTLDENLSHIQQYRRWIDMAELRVDYLDRDERLHIRKFPELAKLPVILTIRRKIDGGKYVEGEAARTTLFARGLAFAEQDTRKNFAYVDFEEDFRVPCLQDAALAFSTRVIRSVHSLNAPVRDIAQRIQQLRITGFEIPKIAFMPHSLHDVTNLFREARQLQETDCILCAMGLLGLPSRILSTRLHSYLTYTSPKKTEGPVSTLGHLDPETLSRVFRFETLDEQTSIYAVAGYPIEHAITPRIQNPGFSSYGLNSVYIPVNSQTVEEMMAFAAELEMPGFSVSLPHKESIMEFADEISAEAGDIGACNTMIRHEGSWYGYNTDSLGLNRAITEFLQVKNLRGWRVSIIGAGGAARAAAYMVKMLGGRACIFNRTHIRARKLADLYGFEWAPLDEDFLYKMEAYADLLVYAIPRSTIGQEGAGSETDLLSFFEFNGHEALYDMTYDTEPTLIQKRALEAGCKVSNGISMLKYQSARQFHLFTGLELEGV